jgi:primosomal protein N' (replication factor Y)
VIVARPRAPAEQAGRRLRSIEEVIDPEPVLSPTMIAILREEAARVLCPVGLALASALPPGSSPRWVELVHLTPRGQEALRSGAVRGPARALLADLARRPRPSRALARGAPEARALLGSLERDGLLERRSGQRSVGAREAHERVASLAPGLDLEWALGNLARAPKQAALLREVASSAPLPLVPLVHRMPGGAAALRALRRRGFVEIEERPVRARIEPALREPADRVQLTGEQAEALEEIASAVRSRRAERFLLHGITGSGKTEVYLRALAEALALGRQALVLVPEITLTHQIVARLRARFGDRVAVLHSGLPASQRLTQWELLRSGATPIAVGARSALFAPLEDLGVIVIDEEHEPSYKNEEGFRYHARELASRRAGAAGCPLVLGSATPSLETRFGAERGWVRRLVLTRRIGGRPLPAVEIVDLNRERAMLPRGRKLLLSAPLRGAIREALADGGQIILFLNRRGFSTQIVCFQCNHVERCKHCAISLVYHASEERLRCHYCDYSILPPEVCSQCASPETALLGVGTERLVEEVHTQFPGARVARLDRDAAARAGVTEQTLQDLAEGRIDVLVGTQLVAKGHDFPGVRVVGVINADLGLHFPDFRAAERTFQLLTQVAGRAGRGAAPGRVILQSFVPDHYAIRPVVEHDYEAFYQEELQHRAALQYPPLGHLAQAILSGTEEDRVAAGAHRLVEGLRSEEGFDAARAPFEILGPAPAPIARLRGRYRFQILLKGVAEATVREAARRLQRHALRLDRAVRVSVDLQPIHML